LVEDFFVSSFLQDRKQHTATTKDLFIILFKSIAASLAKKSKLNWLPAFDTLTAPSWFGRDPTSF
jgi:hypothetical protein